MKKLIFQFFFASLVIIPPVLCTEPISVSITPEHQQALEQRLNDFRKVHLAALSVEDLQYFTNLIYYTYAFGSLEIHVYGKAQEILSCAKATHTGLINYTEITNVKEQLVKNLNTIDCAVSAKTNLMKALEYCSKAKETIRPDSILLQSLEELENIIDYETSFWASKKVEEFSKQWMKSAEVLMESGESLSSIGYTHSHPTQMDLALPHMYENKYLETIFKVSCKSSEAEKQCWQAFDAAMQMAEADVSLLTLSISLLGLYYKQAYQELALRGKHYCFFMYDEQGFIEPDQRTLPLPKV